MNTLHKTSTGYNVVIDGEILASVRKFGRAWDWIWSGSTVPSQGFETLRQVREYVEFRFSTKPAPLFSAAEIAESDTRMAAQNNVHNVALTGTDIAHLQWAMQGLYRDMANPAYLELCNRLRAVIGADPIA